MKFYNTMGIKENASESEIKKAYKKLAMVLHPDKELDESKKPIANQKFQELTEAYSVLSDPAQRKMYDEVGYDMLKNQSSGGMPNPQDIFEQFFGNNMFGQTQGFSQVFGQAFGQGFGREQESDNIDCVVEKKVSLEDIYCKKSISVGYKQNNYCKPCNGNGTKDGTSSKCMGCNGSGNSIKIIQRGNVIQQMVGKCNECNGSGSMINKSNVCNECNGTKVNTTNVTLEVTLNHKIINSNKIVLEKKGHIMKTGIGRLIIVIQEQMHDVFKRQGNDLHVNIKLRLFQTLFGFTKILQHMDNRNLQIKSGPLKKMDTIMRIKNEGIGGDLFIHITTSMPHISKLEESDKAILKKLLINANIKEYTKEMNLANSTINIVDIASNNIEEIGNIEEEVRQMPQMPSPPQQSHGIPNMMDGNQCAQQ